MLRRARNRRKPGPKRSWLPAINWRALGTSLAAVAGVLAAVAVVLWALDQPIETVYSSPLTNASANTTGSMACASA